MKPDFAKGLVPCVVQDHRSGEVLMLAYMNEEAYQKTLDTGDVYYFSRSRNELWRKGATSGHTQRLMGMGLDCDQDTLVAQVAQTGPACHTGADTCFTNVSGRHLSMLVALDRLIADRIETPTGGWTDRLLASEDLRFAKIREEAEEVIMAAQGDNDDSLAHEVADLWYHSLVAARAEGVSVAEILAELARRHGGRN